MVKPEWGTKRACPKCNTRFYDLRVVTAESLDNPREDPVTCINCGNTWAPERILKSKQTSVFEAAKPTAAAGADADEEVIAEEELDLEGADAAPDEEDVDIGGDEDIGVPTGGDEEEV